MKQHLIDALALSRAAWRDLLTWLNASFSIILLLLLQNQQVADQLFAVLPPEARDKLWWLPIVVFGLVQLAKARDARKQLERGE